MNSAHLHIILVHIPIVLTPLGLILLTFNYWKNGTYSKTALMIFLSAAIFGTSAFLFGEGAEEIVENYPGVKESLIESHEESATVALCLILAVGVLSTGVFIALQSNKKVPGPIMPLIMLLSGLATLSLAYTAQEGGKIRHPEVFAATSDYSATRAGSDDD